MYSLVTVALALSASASAYTVPVKKAHGRTGPDYLKGLPEVARARAAHLKAKGSSIPASNLDYVQYTSSIGVGSPATYYNLVIDTGSSNTFVGTGKKYVKTNTSVATGQAVNVTYGSGYFTGNEYYDDVTIGPGFVIKNQSIGDALKYAQFEGVDGIIGVGPVDLTEGTLPNDKKALIPTVTNNAVSQKLISSEILGVSFAPSTKENDTNGALTFGGADSAYYTGKISYTPLTKTSPSSYYWGVNVTKATYGTKTIIGSSAAGIVDTGTTQILIADDWFSKYVAAISGAKLDDSTGLLVIPTASVADIKPFNFTIGGAVYSLDADAQLVPESENTAWGGKSGVRYGYFGNMGSNSGEGLDFIIGQKFMERYYAVFDSKNKRVGFAQT
ncbi:hypothetical protein PLICRDRAFT_114346 [Plicaturopsis crispa FD-325 SS-3]|nr:hypothetical protein PLICRDRAFT_114346 [Plicaturopsis crispa FD-325 SS-3]